MIFLSPGEKIKNIRTTLGIKQVDLTAIGVSRNYISMVESDKRVLSKNTLEKLVNFLNATAKEKNIILTVDMDDLALTREEEATNYCLAKLKEDLPVTELDKLVSIGEKFKLINILPQLYESMGHALYKKNQFNKASIFFYNALELYVSSNTADKYRLYNCLGKCKLETLSYEEALAYLFKAQVHVCEDFTLEDAQNYIFNIALAYKKLGEFDNALLYINKLTEIFVPEKNLTKYIDTVILAANCFLEKNEYDSAIKLYTETISSYGSSLDISLGYIYNNLGIVFLKIRDFSSSIIYFNKAIVLRQKLDKRSLSHSIIDKAEVYLESKSYDKAIKLLKSGIELTKLYNDKEYLVRGYKYLEQCYILLGDKRNLEIVYLNMISLLKDCPYIDIKDIYIKLSIIYLDWQECDKCKNILYDASKLLVDC